MLKVLKVKEKHPTKIIYPIKLSFKNKREIQTFPDKQKLRKFVPTKTNLEEVLKGHVQVEM